MGGLNELEEARELAVLGWRRWIMEHRQERGWNTWEQDARETLDEFAPDAPEWLIQRVVASEWFHAP